MSPKCNGIVFQCSKSCGKGVKLRGVYCVNLGVDGATVNDRRCKSRKKPQEKKYCNKFTCPFKWISGEWSEVSYQNETTKYKYYQ